MRQISILIGLLFCLGLAVAHEPRTGYRSRPLNVGDRIEILLSGTAQPPFEALVTSDGSIRIPNLGSVPVSGLGLVETRTAIEKALAELGKPSEVLVRRIVTKDHPISFTGAFRKAGSVQAWRDATLGDLLSLAVPTDRADLENVEIWSIDGSLLYLDASLSASAARNTKLKPGDQVFVAELSSVPQITILGAVNRPGVITYRAGITAKEAIESAGGLMNRADAEKIRIERDGKPVDTINFELNYNAPLKSGDVVIVPLKPEPQYVTINGGVKKQGLLDFREGMTLSEAIKAAGGTTVLAELGKISIMRRVNGALTRQKVDLNKIREGKQADIVLQANDSIDVPVKKPTGPATNPPGSGGGGGMQEPQS
ncbi:MAG: SLBB domain-containing protein [Fimbriimonadaceae bacterium]|nr:SLBB domain-containing protein [Fimbriimonadaceae bacterium]